MRQHLAHELLDDDEGTPAEIDASLADLSWIHAHLGGRSSWRQLIGALPRARSVLDVGAGRGSVAAEVGACLGAVQVVCLDRRTSHMGAAGLRVGGDGMQMPFGDASFDLVMCNLFLHHFHGETAARLLQEMARVARRAVVINDLERALAPYWVIRLGAIRFSRLTRNDGPRSVRQAYTFAELDTLLSSWKHQVLRLSHYRLGAIVWCHCDV